MTDEGRIANSAQPKEESRATDNKRIAKNTFMLYIRMIVILGVSLFTSRVVLKALGVDDFGIYNVVGGIVAMLGVFNQSLLASTQRYLNFGIGAGDAKHLNKIFSVSINLYGLLCLIFVIIAETVGLWFLNYKMNIPADRMFAANVVYQFTILTVMAGMMTNVYNAVIIAHEKMSFYAWLSIVEVIMRLAIVYLLYAIGFDKLIFYGIFIFVVQLLICLAYMMYCRNYFPETKYRYYSDKKLFKELLSFSGWNMFGAISGMLKTQGLNILLNIFFGPAVNASRGIAVQVNSAISRFCDGFITAVKPQLTISYAKGEMERFFMLLTRSSKFSGFLMLFLSLPILVQAPFLINFWLGQLPDYVVSFTRLIILITIVDSMAVPLMTACQATGRIKMYQILVGSIVMLNIPISYVALKLGGSPDIVFTISLIIAVFCLLLRVWVVKYLVPEFDAFKFVKEALLLTAFVGAISAAPAIALAHYWHDGLYTVIAACLITLLCTAVSCYYVGMSRGERAFVGEMVWKKLFHRKK